MRQFLLDHIGKLMYRDDLVNLHGSVPMKRKAYADTDQPSEASEIRFCIETKITRQEMLEGRKVSVVRGDKRVAVRRAVVA